jgi:leader peptidase (prepilin peptidase)/N-methyltransferase
VELLTAGLYLLSWERFGLPLAPIYWIFLSLLLAATFIDFDHLIIPDEITLGGTVVGMCCAALLPELMGVSIWWQGLLLSLLAAALGYFLLWGVVELGKKAFGRHRVPLEAPLLMELSALEKEGVSEAFLKLGEEIMPCEDFFYRESDRIEALCTWIEIGGERLGPGCLSIGSDTVKFESREWAFTQLPEERAFRAEISELILPREAMGFGDVKFLACIGAFLGWKGVLFSLFAGSLVGALIGIAMLLATRGRSGGKIPFGPYLALGAALWVFAGPRLLTLYLSVMQR